MFILVAKEVHNYEHIYITKHTHTCAYLLTAKTGHVCLPRERGRVPRILPAEKLAEFGTFSGKFHACLVCG